MTNHRDMIDELRLRFIEERDHIEILASKKQPEEAIRLKRLRHELLGEIGKEFARMSSKEATNEHGQGDA